MLAKVVLDRYCFSSGSLLSVRSWLFVFMLYLTEHLLDKYPLCYIPCTLYPLLQPKTLPLNLIHPWVHSYKQQIQTYASAVNSVLTVLKFHLMGSYLRQIFHWVSISQGRKQLQSLYPSCYGSFSITQRIALTVLTKVYLSSLQYHSVQDI